MATIILDLAASNTTFANGTIELTPQDGDIYILQSDAVNEFKFLGDADFEVRIEDAGPYSQGSGQVTLSFEDTTNPTVTYANGVDAQRVGLNANGDSLTVNAGDNVTLGPIIGSGEERIPSMPSGDGLNADGGGLTITTGSGTTVTSTIDGPSSGADANYTFGEGNEFWTGATVTGSVGGNTTIVVGDNAVVSANAGFIAPLGDLNGNTQSITIGNNAVNDPSTAPAWEVTVAGTNGEKTIDIGDNVTVGEVGFGSEGTLSTGLGNNTTFVNPTGGTLTAGENLTVNEPIWGTEGGSTYILGDGWDVPFELSGAGENSGDDPVDRLILGEPAIQDGFTGQIIGSGNDLISIMPPTSSPSETADFINSATAAQWAENDDGSWSPTISNSNDLVYDIGIYSFGAGSPGPAPNQIVDGENDAEFMGDGYDDANGPTYSGGDIIDGADGDNDVILGNGGDDTINAGAGTDEVYGGSGNDVIDGGAGNDTLTGDFASDVTDTVVDNSTVAGDDILEGGVGDDVIYGDSGNSLSAGGEGVPGDTLGDGPGSTGGGYARVSGQSVTNGAHSFATDAFHLGNDIPVLDGADRDALVGVSFSQDGAGTDRTFGLDELSFTGAQRSFVGLVTVQDSDVSGANDQFSSSISGGFQDTTVVSSGTADFTMNDGTVFSGIRVNFVRGPDGETYMMPDDGPSPGAFNAFRNMLATNDSGIASFTIATGSGAESGINPIEGNWGDGQFKEPEEGDGGDDTIIGGEGADTMFGEGGDDTFVVGSAADGAGDVISGGYGPDENTDNDVLDLTGAGPVTITQSADANDAGATSGTVTFADGSTLTFEGIETIIQDPDNSAPVLDPITDPTIDENSTDPVFTASATDPDGDPVTYSLTGDDAALFNIDPTTGEVTPIAGLDAENPTDSNGDGVYDITVVATDPDGATDEEPVAITVGDVNEAPVLDPITDPTIDENSTDPVFTASATDPDGDPVTYSLTGDDAALFTINPTTGEVTPVNPLDFENPTDADGNNVYNITVVATDPSGLTDQEDVAITVADLNEPDGVVDGEATGEVMAPGYDDANGPTDGGGDVIGAGNDSIEGNGGDDTIDGGDGNDTIDGGADDDSITGGDGDDSVLGGDGSDTLAGGEGTDTLDGGDGDDDIAVGGDDTGLGGSGDDVFTIDPTDPAPDVAVTIDGGTDGTVPGEEAGPENGDEGDVLDLSDETGDLDVVLATDPESGTVDGIDTIAGDDDITFDEIEKVLTGTGNDSIDGGGSTGPIDVETGGGDDTVAGGTGDDTIDGGDDNDSIDGGDGDDSIAGGAGTDTLTGGLGNDTLDGGDGDDDLVLGSGDTGLGGGGDDEFILDPTNTDGPGTITIDGGADATSGSPADTANGDAGDTLDFTGLDNVTIVTPLVDDGTGSFSGQVSYTNDDGEVITVDFTEIENVLGLPGGPDGVVDGEATGEVMAPGYDDANGPTDGGGDVIGAGNDSIEGNGGDDTIDGGDGNDTIDGGADDDSITGGDGDDSVLGGDGSDTLAGGEGTDTLDGGDGDDDIAVGGDDSGIGGSGDDVFTIDPTDPAPDVAVTIDGGTDGTVPGEEAGPENGDEGDVLDLSDETGDLDVVLATDPESGTVDGIDTIAGDDDITFDEIEKVLTGTGNDSIDGGGSTGPIDVETGGGDDTVAGGTGDDTIDGGDDDDSIDGGDGDDSIAGGAGTDTLTGGLGADTIDGGAGDDDITVGAGDVATGGSGDDDFFLDPTNTDGPDTITIDGGTDGTSGFPDDLANDDDGDTLDFTGLDNVTIVTPLVDDGTGSFSGQVSYTNDEGEVITVDFTEIENVLGLPGGPDGVVDGETTGELMDVGYDDSNGPTDGGGDQITNNADSIEGNGGDDTINGGGGNDTIDGGDDDDVIDGGLGDDSVLGGDGADSVVGGDGADTIYGGSNVPADNLIDDNIDPGQNDPDTLNGQDTLDGGAGNDVIFGEDDDDSITGGTGNDSLDGGIDDDTLSGGDGEDTLIGGQGADSMSGGLGDDTFLVGTFDDPNNPGDSYIEGIGDTIVGGEDPGDTDTDTLDLTGSGPLTVIPSAPGAEDGIVEFYSDPAKTNLIGTLAYSEIENIIPCFTPGTLIATMKGEVPVESLQEGDKVITRDNGIQEVRWIGKRTLQRDELRRAPHLSPILIKAGSLGDGLPERDMMVSPQHRMLVAGDQTQLYFEEPEVLVAAKHLINNGSIQAIDTLRATYIHFMFDQHEVVLADGAWTESFQPGDQTLGAMGTAQRNEILELFPDLEMQTGRDDYVAARRVLKGYEAKLLKG